jgi:hypothetical protein
MLKTKVAIISAVLTVAAILPAAAEARASWS